MGQNIALLYDAGTRKQADSMHTFAEKYDIWHKQEVSLENQRKQKKGNKTITPKPK